MPPEPRPHIQRALDLAPKDFERLTQRAVFNGVFWALFGWSLVTGFAVVVLALVVSCGGESGDGGSGGAGGSATADVCEPGRSEACAGPGSCEGAQVCNGDGTAWGSCDCEEPTGSGGAGGAGGSGGAAANMECVYFRDDAASCPSAALPHLYVGGTGETRCGRNFVCPGDCLASSLEEGCCCPSR